MAGHCSPWAPSSSSASAPCPWPPAAIQNQVSNCQNPPPFLPLAWTYPLEPTWPHCGWRGRLVFSFQSPWSSLALCPTWVGMAMCRQDVISPLMVGANGLAGYVESEEKLGMRPSPCYSRFLAQKTTWVPQVLCALPGVSSQLTWLSPTHPSGQLTFFQGAFLGLEASLVSSLPTCAPLQPWALYGICPVPP